MTDEQPAPTPQRPTTSIEDAVRWWGNGDHTSMLYYLEEWENYSERLEAELERCKTLYHAAAQENHSLREVAGDLERRLEATKQELENFITDVRNISTISMLSLNRSEHSRQRDTWEGDQVPPNGGGEREEGE